MNTVIRKTMSLCDEWRFCLGDVENAFNENFDDNGWEILDLPHDWSICGEFSSENPTTARGGYLTSGIGWYRKHFFADKNWKNKRVIIEFEGIYRHATVWLNGKKLGYRPNGWVAQHFDITDYISYNSENVLAVRADNSDQPGARYYTGAGIYRDVSIIVTGKTCFENSEPYITTSVDNDTAEISINAQVVGVADNCRTEYVLYDDKEIVVATASADVVNKSCDAKIKLNQFRFWDISDPYLYTMHSVLYCNDEIVDDAYTRIGIRTIEFFADKGFYLNGKRVQVQGVCLHHDNGALGAACYKDADRRRISVMKEMGANAIRLSHNPFAKSFLDLCDEMGMLVMAEAFDEWRMPKCIPALNHKDINLKMIVHNYYMDFDKWHEEDLKDFIIRDRNHPCIFMWSIGNEIAEQRHNVAEGIQTAAKLKEIVRKYDCSRPVTSACCLGNEGTRDSGFIDVLDVAGYNYEDIKYAQHKKAYPDTKVIGSETTSLTWFRKRGWYHPKLFGFINDRYRRQIRDNGGEIIENTDIEDNVTRRLLIGEHTMQRHLNNPHVAGMFIWTGMDYLGEPTPYTWPSRSSYFGVTDTCGFPKDAYYYYQAKWSNKYVIHPVTHWNWNELKGETINIIAFSNCDSIELFLNGKSMGICEYEPDYADHFHWEILYESGTLEFVGYKDGKEVVRNSISSANTADAIKLSVDKKTIAADKHSLVFVTAEIIDSDGILVPDAQNRITFEVSSGLIPMGVDNGDPEYIGSLKADTIPALAGKCMFIARSNGETGTFKISAIAEGLKGDSVEIKTI